MDVGQTELVELGDQIAVQVRPLRTLIDAPTA
jgi:hypothetical protein